MSQALADTFGCTATVVNCIALGSDPNTLIPHLESQYIHSIRQFLKSINGSIRTEIPYTVPLQRVRDQSIMEIVVHSNLFSAQECKTINYCRQFLRVHTLSDIALAGGTQIDPSFLMLSPSLPGSMPECMIGPSASLRRCIISK